MADSPLRLDAYLERVRYSGPLVPSAETLCRLHRAQAASIPFENLDIFLGKPIKLEPASIVAKLVDERRGGYCYELNGLLAMVLECLGFAVTPLAARVFRDGSPQQKSHRLTLVEFGGERWLADVGFGGNSLIEAIPLEIDREFPQHLEMFRLRADTTFGFVLQHKFLEQWQNLYAFSLEEHYPADYRMMNHYNSTSSASTFTQHCVCTIPTSDARIILTDFELKMRYPNETITTQIESEELYRETLQRYFGIVLPPGSRLQSPYAQFRMPQKGEKESIHP